MERNQTHVTASAGQPSGAEASQFNTVTMRRRARFNSASAMGSRCVSSRIQSNKDFELHCLMLLGVRTP